MRLELGRPQLLGRCEAWMALVAGDVGHGLIVFVAALALGRLLASPPAMVRLLAGAGALMAVAGLLYGEFLGFAGHQAAALPTLSTSSFELPLNRVEVVSWIRF